VGISSALNGLADIGMVSRALEESELERLTPVVVALDGIAFIAHASNSVAGLSSEQVEQIYSGAITNWAAVGGHDAEIVVINKEEGRATLHVVEEHFGLRGRFVKNAIVIGPNGQAITTLAGNPDAIAYVSISAAEAARHDGTPIRLLSLDEVIPTAENVRGGEYTVKRPLLLVTGPTPSATARDFLSFILSPSGQQTVAELGFVPVSSDDDPNAAETATHDQELAEP
jgi:phosphate transport system substrate-binding protein